MSTTNERGQYGGCARVGAETRPYAPSSRTTSVPWVIGGVGLVAVGLVLLGKHVVKRPRLNAHDEEIRAWEAEFPGLPWYMDRIKDARQLDTWERARDHWERHGGP